MGDVSLPAVLHNAEMNNSIISTCRTILIVQFRDNHTVGHSSAARPSVQVCPKHAHACCKTGLHPDRAVRQEEKSGLCRCWRARRSNTQTAPAHKHTQTDTKAGLKCPRVFPTAAPMKNSHRSDLIGYFEPISDLRVF